MINKETLNRLGLYYRTIKKLRLVQVVGRVWFRLYKPKCDYSPAPSIQPLISNWIDSPCKPISLVGPGKFLFLGETRTLSSAGDWNHSSWDKLWLYNLHYFDDLNALRAGARRAQHLSLVDRWVAENPPPIGNGWEPYPLSLRIVNWIKWSCRGNELADEVLHSLAIQIRYLCRRLEFHILGNHLFENAKALVFAGLYFQGQESGQWLNKGLSLLEKEISEQILDDGGHFERSPMYHAIILEDLLDMVNLMSVYGRTPPFNWAKKIEKMFRWLRTMCHPDGEISLFNDAALGVASSLVDLKKYGTLLGFNIEDSRIGSLEYLESSGYVRMEQGSAVILLDVAPLGPDYLPGHGHADTLTFELSLRGKRIVVNSGTSLYGIGSERQRQRGTGAHNTVRIDERDSSEVWGGFRVGSRASPYDVVVKRTSNGLFSGASHDGYQQLSGSPVHRREWEAQENSLVVTDYVSGSGFHFIELMYHFHPSVTVYLTGSHRIELRDDKQGRLLSLLEIDSRLDVRVLDSSYHPEFGANIPAKKLVAECHSALPFELTTRFLWGTEFLGVLRV